VKRAAGSARSVLAPAPSVAHVVKFEQRPERGLSPQQPVPSTSVPRVARLLALAHRIDEMIRSGEIRDWAEAARLAAVTRARMTQIANLRLLSPAIQELIMAIPPIAEGNSTITERRLRQLTPITEWSRQERELHSGEQD